MPTVLLIDDDPVQLRVREAVLRRAGFEVAVATSAESALALLRSRSDGAHVRAVVTDHVMPRSTGAQFVRQLRDIEPGLPVIVVTGLAEAEPDYQGLDVVFRQKPLAPTELIALVRQAVESGQSGC